jgi:molecular chaperone GrpE
VSEEKGNCCNPVDEDSPDCCCGEKTPAAENNQEQGIDPSADIASEMLVKAEEEIASLNQQLRTKEAQMDELVQRLQRLQSDFDNFRRRTQREKEEFVQTAAASVVEMLLPVMDNFERASQSSSADEGAFREGIELIFKQLEKVLGDAGLEPVVSVGITFDPNLHQAVFMVEDDSCDENTVVEELQKGYLFAGKVLRPAMVKVSHKSTV